MEMLLRRLALAVGIVCGLVGTQGPEFAQQYRQRLAGAVDELTRVVQTFDNEAHSEHLTPDDAIRRLEENGDPLARERGQAITDDKLRLERLEDALAAYADAAPVRRLVGIVQGFDPVIARRAWSDFEPAIPTTFEALIVGALGLVVGWAATHLVVWPARRSFARRREMANT